LFYSRRKKARVDCYALKKIEKKRAVYPTASQFIISELLPAALAVKTEGLYLD